MAGGGILAARASDALARFAEAAAIPVVASYGRNDLLPNIHPYFYGHMGLGAADEAVEYAMGADVVLAIGTKLAELSTMGYKVPTRDARLIHIDLDPDAFSVVRPPSPGLVAEAAISLEVMTGFVPEVIARWDDARVERALSNPGIIRSRAKVQATIGNAKAYLRMREGGLEFSDYLWAFVDGKPLDGRLESWRSVPAKTALSERLAKDMKKRGFTFCGPTIVYACMQAVGMVNDHEIRCPRYREVKMSN